MTDSFETVWRERADNSDRVELLEGELKRYRELEGLLRTTLVSAERAAHELKDQAKREASTRSSPRPRPRPARSPARPAASTRRCRGGERTPHAPRSLHAALETRVDEAERRRGRPTERAPEDPGDRRPRYALSPDTSRVSMIAGRARQPRATGSVEAIRAA